MTKAAQSNLIPLRDSPMKTCLEWIEMTRRLEAIGVRISSSAIFVHPMRWSCPLKPPYSVNYSEFAAFEFRARGIGAEDLPKNQKNQHHQTRPTMNENTKTKEITAAPPGILNPEREFIMLPEFRGGMGKSPSILEVLLHPQFREGRIGEETLLKTKRTNTTNKTQL